jgi:hypothetical protein
MMTRATIVIAGACLCATVSVATAEIFVSPKQGQTQQQFENDQFQCHKMAENQTGFNPSQPVQVAAPPPSSGGAVRGAGRGAALGAIGGAIGGDAGKGAAIGAGVGAAAGLMRQSSQNAQAAQATQQAQAQQQANLGRYEQAYGGCMGGRGYQYQVR